MQKIINYHWNQNLLTASSRVIMCVCVHINCAAGEGGVDVKLRASGHGPAASSNRWPPGSFFVLFFAYYTRPVDASLRGC